MITVHKLTKSYNGKCILENIDLTIQGNQITFLMGENGSGKTTFIKAVLNLEEYGGEVTFSKKRIDQSYGEISVVYDDSPLYLGLNGYQNIKLLCNRGVDADTIRRASIPFLNEEELKKKASNYSYGQRKKIAIITALLNKSKYILIDEVSSGLDYESIRQLKKILREVSKNTLVFLTGRHVDFYNDIVEDILILKDRHITHYPRTEAGKMDSWGVYERNCESV